MELRARVFIQAIKRDRMADRRYAEPDFNPDHEFNRTMIGLALKIVLIVIGVLILLMSSMTIWYSFRFGMPIIHTIKWIVNLSKGRFEEPRNRKGRPRSRNKREAKQPYRLFTEVFESMEQLTETLKKTSKTARKSKRPGGMDRRALP